MTWIQPVYDRTLLDVDQAKKLQASTQDVKGSLNASDLNRIEENCEFLATALRSRGYDIDVSVKTDWSRADIPSFGQLLRIANNTKDLIQAYFWADATRDIEISDGVDYETINAMEFDLYYVNEMINSMDLLCVPAGAYDANAVGYIARETFDVGLVSSDDYDLYGSEDMADVELYARAGD